MSDNHTLNPRSRRHCLCASISSLQSSGPFSKRNSFGTPREFVTSWLYTRDNNIFNDSINRASIFYDEPVEKMVNYPRDYFINNFAKAYYLADKSKFVELCKNFDVDYFVWNMEYTKPDFLIVIYESESHYILELENGCK